MDDVQLADDWKVLDAGAGLVEGQRAFFTATGDERREFLHGQTTANVEALKAGNGAPALVLNAQGRALSILSLYEDGEKLWIATAPGLVAATRAALSRFLVADDCDFEADIAAGSLTIAGPEAAGVLAASGIALASEPGSWGLTIGSIDAQSVHVFSRGDLRVPSFDVLACHDDGRPTDIEAVRRALHSAGAVDCAAEALDVVRMESGTARYGADVDEARLAVEARVEWAIHFAKGCYVGQEVVERAVSRGRINHELALVAASAPVAPGAQVEGGGERDVVTSAAVSPHLGPIALAYLPKTMLEPGTTLTLVAGDGLALDRSDSRTAAVVLEWPRSRKLPGRG
jgi:folate-binding protein YgfZ